MPVLNDKVAIVTGGGSGIGAATARAMAAAGARVVVADHQADGAEAVVESIVEAGGTAMSVLADVSVEADVAAMVDAAVSNYGALHILHNNAAALELALLDGPIHELDIDVWSRAMGVNATGVMLGCKHAIPHLLAAGGGSIVNTASASGHAGDTSRSAYGASKGAVIAFTQNVATQYGKRGIRCNAISPGIVVTDVVEAFVPQVVKDMWLRHTLTPRLGRPEDIAELAVFLASDAAGFITGQTLIADGGLTAHQPWAAEVDDVFAEVAAEAARAQG